MIWFCFVGWFFPLFVYSYYNPWTSQVFDMITGVNIYHFTMYQTSTLCEWASELSLGAFPWSVPLMCPCLVAALRPPHPATAPSALQSTVDICLDHIMWTKTHCAMWNLYKILAFHSILDFWSIPRCLRILILSLDPLTTRQIIDTLLRNNLAGWVWSTSLIIH